MNLTRTLIKNEIARTNIIFTRGENIFALGNYTLAEKDYNSGQYAYTFDGSYGDYEVSIRIEDNSIIEACTCPYPHKGCKHIVAACLDIAERKKREEKLVYKDDNSNSYLTPEEIKSEALDARKRKAKKEGFTLFPGDTYKGYHTVKTLKGKEYRITIYNPEEQTGHCTCPDFATNHLDTCKHLIFTYNKLSEDKAFKNSAKKEIFPFVHFSWNSRLNRPVCYYEQIKDPVIDSEIQKLFNEKGVYTRDSITGLFKFYSQTDDSNNILQFDDYLLKRINDLLYEKEIRKLEKKHTIDFSFLKTELYPYQLEGVRFAVFKKAAIIADEMGLGKTLQAISIALLKKEIFGFEKILVVCPSSLKSQWKKEIEKYTDASALIISGSRLKRQALYSESTAFFKITNYEALLRDKLTVSEWHPDFVILDEAQRIKNFETKTHQAVQSIPHNHSLIITGTPLENKLEDLYSIVQFSDPTLLTPLWAFAAHHFNLDTQRKNKVLGYRNLKVVFEKIQPLLIRRKKIDVIDNLPEKIENNYYFDLSTEQEEIHQGYMASLFRIISKKVLTPMDIKLMQKILLSMRRVCDSTYLIDKKTNISPKLVELVTILKDLVIENKRKIVIFSEWTTMTYLIGKVLSEMGIDFVEFTGKVPVEKRQVLIDEFHDNPECMVFLSTDAGGVGLNLQVSDCVINFELPWNPAKLNQRIGRIHRIGQKHSVVNVINLITKRSIEEKVYAGINLKQELFDAALEGARDDVDLSRENKNKFINQVREMFDGEKIEINTGSNADEEKPELDELTPHYLNPEIFKKKETEIDISAEEFEEDPVSEKNLTEEADNSKHLEIKQKKETSKSESVKQMEIVLNQGMDFLNSLSMMTTGKSLADGSNKKSVEINQETGEVVMRFKLPGFGG
ncbi:MAG: DEAD/DEAH box helicase [Spirochaetaceae bacterium]|nr:DEAD/DEAH box helicase [Spirochaetaceae bacterium]